MSVPNVQSEKQVTSRFVYRLAWLVPAVVLGFAGCVCGPCGAGPGYSTYPGFGPGYSLQPSPYGAAMYDTQGTATARSLEPQPDPAASRTATNR